METVNFQANIARFLLLPRNMKRSGSSAVVRLDGDRVGSRYGDGTTLHDNHAGLPYGDSASSNALETPAPHVRTWRTSASVCLMRGR